MPLKNFFTCRSGRDGPLLSSEKKVDKDSRGGAVAPPSNPHSCALRPISPFPALLAGLSGHSAANRRQIRETLEKPRSRAQLFKRFCAKGDACALSPISPFLSLLAGLAALRAANRRLIRETPEKPRSRAQLFGRFCAWGNGWPHVFIIYESLARAFARQASSRPQGTGARPFSLPGKTGAMRGRAPGNGRVRARRGEEKDTVRELPGAAARGRSRQGKPLCGQPTHYKLHRG